jgi:deoxycytidylate deaminase
VGYNGFPSGIDDSDLPRVRPGKYTHMIHAEQNAISNMITKEKDLTAYVTAHPCRTCANLLWQNGVRTVIIDKYGVFYSMSEDDIKAINVLIKNGLSLIDIEFDNTIFQKLKVKTDVD